MPNYDFICQRCQKRLVKFLTYAEYGNKSVDCPYCGSDEVARHITRVRIARSEDTHLENSGEFSSPESMAQMEQNPQALGRMMRRMSSELGEEMEPEFNEVVNRLEKGQSPDEIEKDLPDYTGGKGFASGDNADLE